MPFSKYGQYRLERMKEEMDVARNQRQRWEVEDFGRCNERFHGWKVQMVAPSSTDIMLNLKIVYVARSLFLIVPLTRKEQY
jgi:hypothetical protein